MTVLDLVAALIFMSILSFAMALLARRREPGGVLAERLARLRGEVVRGPLRVPRRRRLAIAALLDALARPGRVLVPEDARERILRAGLDWTPDRFGAARLLFAGGALVVAGFGAAGIFGTLLALLPFGLIGAVVGWNAPEAWLNAASRARQAKVAAELPNWLDQVAVIIRAGVPLEVAVERAAEEAPGLVSRTFRTALGASAGQTVEEGLAWVERTLSHPDVAAVCRAILGSRLYGQPVGVRLEELAQAMRAERKERVRERGARAAASMVLPLTLAIMLPTLVLLGYPAWVSLQATLFGP